MVRMRRLSSCASFALLAVLTACESPATPSAPGVESPPRVLVDTVSRANPPAVSSSRALVVDSFTVIEYRVSCAWACPYVAYAPLLKLREPTGKQGAEVISIEFTLGSKTTGACRGSVIYAAGSSAFLDGVYEYLWSNDLIFVSLDGQPLPGDVATARATVRAGDGTLGIVEATGRVQRMVSAPLFPEPRSNGWACH